MAATGLSLFLSMLKLETFNRSIIKYFGDTYEIS